MAARIRALVRRAMSPWRRRRDEDFVERAYRELLGRPPDADGRENYVRALRYGALTRADVALDLAASREHRDFIAERGVRVFGQRTLPDLTLERAEQYVAGPDLQGRELLAFQVRDDQDFDWLETRIRETGFYDHDGVWTLELDLDKLVLAELIASLRPSSVLELGCASGGVLAGLAARGIDVTGVDVSEHARAQAPAQVRDRIVLGDLLTLDLPGCYDAVVGLDVFEHLNPNHVASYLARLAALAGEEGWCVANIPVFGEDPVFGCVFDDYLEEPKPCTLFRRIHVDDRGYPLHGHLVWATWDWWVERFADAGFTRRPDVEAAIQDRYGDHWRAVSPARRSMYVFRKAQATAGEDDIIEAIRATPSSVLSERS